MIQEQKSEMMLKAEIETTVSVCCSFLPEDLTFPSLLMSTHSAGFGLNVPSSECLLSLTNNSKIKHPSTLSQNNL